MPAIRNCGVADLNILRMIHLSANQTEEASNASYANVYLRLWRIDLDGLGVCSTNGTTITYLKP